MKPSQLNDSSVSEAIETPASFFIRVNPRKLRLHETREFIFEWLPRTTGSRDNHSDMGMDCPRTN